MSTAAELQRKNARMVRQLRHTHEEFDHFVRALSHDMSANFILLESSFSQLKRSLGESASAELDEPIAHIEACLVESKQFLDDLVLLARTGSVQMEPGRVEMAAVLDEVIFEQHELLAGRGIDLEIQRPLPIVWCNRQRVKQIITNLVRNAIKHGCDPGNPKMTISSPEDATPDRQMVAIRVHDNGPGIDPRFFEEIFLPGRRLPGAAEEGSGMGLAIVKKIVEYYGGTVKVDRDCASGTAMMIRLPAVSGTDPRLRDRLPSADHDGPHPESPPQPHGAFGRR